MTELTITLKNIHCLKFPSNKKIALDKLALDDHIHGGIEIRLSNGNTIYNFGYWNEEDACLGEWYTVFKEIKRLLSEGGDFIYDFPYIDQGDPQLEFIFTGDSAKIKTTYYTDDNWDEVEEIVEELTERALFTDVIYQAIESIETNILEASPEIGRKWLER